MSAIDPLTEHDCLADESNLEEQPTGRPEVRIRVCRVCGRRHFEMDAQVGRLGVEVEHL